MKQDYTESNQKILDALNFIRTHRGYLKSGNERLKKRFNLNDEELNILKKNFSSIKNELTDGAEKFLEDNSFLQGYWLKSKRVSAYFKVNQLLSPEELKEFIKRELSDVAKAQIPEIKSVEDTEYIGVLNAYDLHIDKLSVNARDSLDRNYINEYVDSIINSIKEVVLNGEKYKKIKTVVFPVGGDLFNTNGFNNSTKKGTIQRVGIDHSLAFKIGIKFCINVINFLATRGYNVYVPIIYGNHDEDVDFYLGTVLENVYSEISNVFINNSLNKRKYYLFNKNYIAFGHGNLEKNKISELPLVMAVENPEYWSKSVTRIFYLGDLHHKQEFKFLRTKDYPGCTVQFLRSTSLTDQWHQDNMFVGVWRSIEYHIYNESGMVYNLIVNLQ